ncbi:MAG: hypothetical protein SGPRY_008733 [Prymnesium sp.]
MARCSLGSDCADCGHRLLCKLVGASRVRLPRSVLPRTPSTGLRLPQILFMVMGSSKYSHRALLSPTTWCSVEGVVCTFFADSPHPSTTNSSPSSPSSPSLLPSFPFVHVAASYPASCCDRTTGRKGFFCERHRTATLAAQYRFLPALDFVRSSPAFRNGAYRWVVVVDDDSFVFPRKLQWLLSRLDHSKPLYLGDFGSSGEPTRMGIPNFACGGGGSVLSVAALQRMELMRCVRSFHGRCMQSDWMIAGCARRHNVSHLRALGCGTCDINRIDRAVVQSKLRRAECFFMQNVESLKHHLPASAHAPGIVHGLGNSEATEAFFWKYASHMRR